MRPITRKQLKSILAQHKLWLESGRRKGKRADLRDGDLRVADLRGADLRDAYMHEAILRGADLRNADLRGAVLLAADLCIANLRGADLRNADLSGAILRGAILRWADLRDAKGIAAWHSAPIGRHDDVLTAVVINGEPLFITGCFQGGQADLEAAVKEAHGDNAYAAQYRAAIKDALAFFARS